MKTLSFITGVLFLLFGAVASRAANLERISAETGVPVETLQAERTSTGLGWGELEHAHLLANASGQSFDDLVAKHQAGEGWGKIAHDNGLKLGKVVSDAHRSSQATAHAQNMSTVHGQSTAVHGRNTTVHGKSAATVHGKSTTKFGRSHTAKMSSARNVHRRTGFRSASSGSHGMGPIGHVGRGHGGR